MDFSCSTTFHLFFFGVCPPGGRDKAQPSLRTSWYGHPTIRTRSWRGANGSPCWSEVVFLLAKKDVLKLYFLRIYVIQIPFKSLRRLVESVSNKKPISWRIRRFARREPCLGLTCWHHHAQHTLRNYKETTLPIPWNMNPKRVEKINHHHFEEGFSREAFY